MKFPYTLNPNNNDKTNFIRPFTISQDNPFWIMNN